MKTLSLEEVQELFTRIDSLEDKLKAFENSGTNELRDRIKALENRLEVMANLGGKEEVPVLAGGCEECGGLWGGFDDD